MANTLYDKGRQKFLEGSIAFASDTIKVALVDTGTYTFSQTHEFYSSVSGVVGTPQTLASKTTTSGVADAADVTFTAVTGASAEALIIYKDTGSTATSPLIAYIDTATGLPVTPNSGDINIIWDSGANKIFKL
jgi:hypothetical protein